MHRYDLTDAQWRLIALSLPRPLPPRRRRPPLARPPPPGQRHPLAPAHRRPLARHPRALRPLAGRLRPPQPLAPGRHLGQHPRCPPVSPRRRRAHRARPLVRRCLRHPRQPGRRRGGKKIRVTGHGWAGRSRRKWRSRLTMRWAARAAASAPRSTWPATAAASCWRRWSPPGRGTSRRPSSRSCSGRGGRRCGAGRRGRPAWRGTRGTATRARAWLWRHHIEDVIPAQGPAARRALRQGHLPPAEHRGGRGGLVQGVPCPGDPLRQAGGELRRPVDGRRHPLDTPKEADSASNGIVRKSLMYSDEI